MRKNLSQKGFTLIELSIVLVIIGIILGAVLKGQDLIEGAKAKKLTATLNTWNALTWTFMDRTGTFPGDANANGIIGNVVAPENTGPGSTIGVLTAADATANAPTNPVSVGGQTFWVYFGNNPVAIGARNVMVVCTTATCAAGTTLTPDAMRILMSVDTAIDGAADAGLGQFRAGTVTFAGGGGVSATGRATGAITAAAAVSETAAGVVTPWTAGAAVQVAGIWTFDRPY